MLFWWKQFFPNIDLCCVSSQNVWTRDFLLFSYVTSLNYVIFHIWRDFRSAVIFLILLSKNSFNKPYSYTALRKVDQIHFIKVENNQFLLMSWQQINQCSSHLVSKRMWGFFCLLLRWCKATLSSIREKPTALADLFLQTSAFITFSIIISLIDVKLIYI